MIGFFYQLTILVVDLNQWVPPCSFFLSTIWKGKKMSMCTRLGLPVPSVESCLPVSSAGSSVVSCITVHPAKSSISISSPVLCVSSQVDASDPDSNINPEQLQVIKGLIELINFIIVY